MELTKTTVLALLQLTAICVCQKFGVVHRRPAVTSGDKQIAARQQYFNAAQSAVDYGYQPQQLSALEQFYQQQQVGQRQQLPYYPQQQQQKKLLEQQQQSRLQQQQLQLQQLQQFQLQQQTSQQPLSSAAAATAAYYQPQQQQQQQQEQQLYNDFYQQQLQQQQLQLQQQQSYYQQKPLFKPAIPVTETPAEDQPLTATFSQASSQQTNQQSPPNLLGVLYSSAADVSKFQFSGNGVNYSF